MAKYKRRPKVKRYRRSFYSRGMRIRKIVGIVVLVAVVLAAAWFAAPHVLDWATHTWYTVVKDRDLEAESASRAAASSQAAASAAASEAASSAASEPEEDVFDGKAIVSGRWAELDTAALTDDDTLRTTAQQQKAQGVEYAVLTLKDAAGNIYYASQAAAAAGGIVAEPLDAGHIAAILREEKLIPVAQLAAFKDPISPRTDPSMAIHYNGSALWLDAQKNGKPWLNPYSTAAVEYVGDLVEEVQQLGFEQVVLTNVQFPKLSKKRGLPCRPAEGGHCRPAGPFVGQGDPVVQLHAGSVQEQQCGAGRAGPDPGRAEPAGDLGRGHGCRCPAGAGNGGHGCRGGEPDRTRRRPL